MGHSPSAESNRTGRIRRSTAPAVRSASSRAATLAAAKQGDGAGQWWRAKARARGGSASPFMGARGARMPRPGAAAAYPGQRRGAGPDGPRAGLRWAEQVGSGLGLGPIR
jgi:hypothetical protein